MKWALEFEIGRARQVRWGEFGNDEVGWGELWNVEIRYSELGIMKLGKLGELSYLMLKLALK